MAEMTNVINLFGGSGIGKSTTSSGLHYEMKLRHLNAEVVQEYVKKWAWEGKKPGPFDQPYIFGKQSRYESSLYKKVDYIITDSPLLLSPIYEAYHNNNLSIVLPAVEAFLKKAKDNGIIHHNFLLTRHKPFNPQGRYETEDQAINIDKIIEDRLTEWGVSFKMIKSDDKKRVEEILECLGIK